MSGAGRTTADPDTKSTIIRPEETGGTERRPARSRIGKILVLSIWEDTWSLGEGSGVADEVEFIRHLVERGIDPTSLTAGDAEDLIERLKAAKPDKGS